MPPMTTTGDISYRTSGYAARKLLERAQPLLVFNRYGQSKPLPKNASKTIKFRGYDHLPDQPKPLTEGVTPAASKPTFRDVVAEIAQYGDWIELTDQIVDTHEDPILNEFTAILGEQSGPMLEKVTHGKLAAGTNVFFCGSAAQAARGDVNMPLNLNTQRLVLRALKRQLARPITSVVGASPNYDTSAIPPSYIAICHTDCEADIREMPGFVPVEKYGTYKPEPGEIGSVEGVRYIGTTIIDPWEDAGAVPAANTPVLSKSGACADVYPIYYLGKDAYGIIPFAKAKQGDSPVNVMVLNPNVPRGGDALGQRGSVGWKAYHSAVILYQLWMARVEVAVSKL